MQRKQNNFTKKFDDVLQPLVALDANYIRHQLSGTDMAVSLLHFTAFFQWEDNSIERGENHYKLGHV